MRKMPSIYRNDKEEKDSGKKKIKITTVKVIIAVLSLIVIVGVLAVVKTKLEGNIEESQSLVPKDTYQYVYNNSTYINKFQDEILIYDGHSLKFVNNIGNEVQNVTIEAENFSIDTYDKIIYLTDIAKRTTFVIDKNGTIINQVVSKYLPKRVVGMPKNRFVIHYVSDKLEEGVDIYSNKGKLLEEYTYPKLKITLIKPSIKGGIIVTGLYKDSNKLTNLVYEYNSKGALKSTNHIDNLILVDMEIQGRNYIWHDVNQIYVTDSDYKVITKIENSNTYEGILVSADKIYTLDNDNAISVIDSNYAIQKESRFSENIDGIILHIGEPLYYSENRTFYKNNIKELAKPIIKVISNGNTLVLVSKGELKFEYK